MSSWLLVGISNIPSQRETFSFLPAGKQQLLPEHPAAPNTHPTH